METIREAMIGLIDRAKEKQYSKDSVEIIGAIVCSERAVELGYPPLEGLSLALKYVEKYNDEKDCINALIEIIK